MRPNGYPNEAVQKASRNINLRILLQPSVRINTAAWVSDGIHRTVRYTHIDANPRFLVLGLRASACGAA